MSAEGGGGGGGKSEQQQQQEGDEEEVAVEWYRYKDSLRPDMEAADLIISHAGRTWSGGGVVGSFFRWNWRGGEAWLFCNPLGPPCQSTCPPTPCIDSIETRTLLPQAPAR